MKLLTFDPGDGARLGALHHADRVVDLVAAAGNQGGRLPSDLLALIEAGPQALALITRLLSHDDLPYHDLSNVQLGPPLLPRGNVLAIGRNYAAHAEETARARGAEIGRPTVFTKARTSVTGPYSDIVVDPKVTSQVDWEAELGVVIGRRGINIPSKQALDYVFGYTVVNDVSARDVQYGWGGQFFKGKSLDTFCPIGPWIVTADEVPNPQALNVRLCVNGEIKQSASTRDMIFSVAEIIAQLSLGMTLLPGTLIATGTPEGVGFARKPPEFLQAGDVMETEIDGIGLLRNRIVTAS